MEGIDFFETYTPILSWPIICLLLTLSLVCDLAMKQVDYVNAFMQAEVDDDIYVTLPTGFDPQKEDDYILKS